MKGVLICGGTGSRLELLTRVTHKSLLPVYDKPLILYPIGVFLDAGITDIAVITGTEQTNNLKNFLEGIQDELGCRFTFGMQKQPGGIAQALGIAEEFSAGESICAILGDNIFFDNISDTIQTFNSGGHVFLKEVPDPERFGVAEIAGNKVISLVEKPTSPKSNLAQTGCYLYDNRCFDIIRHLKPSPRGELEITDVSKWYMDQGELGFTILQDDWVDAGTYESLFRASSLIRDHRNRKTVVESAKKKATTKMPLKTN